MNEASTLFFGGRTDSSQSQKRIKVQLVLKYTCQVGQWHWDRPAEVRTER